MQCKKPRRVVCYRVRVQVLGVATMTDSDASLTGLPSGKTVKARVTAANSAGESRPSAEVEIPVP